nr:hypothetical protein [Tanacetum cinerariifolium]
MKDYDSAIYLIKKFDFLGVKPGMVSSIYVFNIAINCFCHLKRLEYGFAVLGKVTKLRYELDCDTYNKFIKALCGGDRIGEAVKLFEKIVRCSFEVSVVTYGTSFVYPIVSYGPVMQNYDGPDVSRHMTAYSLMFKCQQHSFIRPCSATIANDGPSCSTPPSENDGPLMLPSVVDGRSFRRIHTILA